MFYIGSNKITPGLFSKGGGASISAINNTGNTIVEGDKVWIDKNGDIYNIVDYYSNKPNFVIHGSPTIVNGIASNFSNGNYITLSSEFIPVNKWEINLKFKTPSVISNGNIISTYGSFDLKKNSICIGINNNNLVYLLSSDGITYSINGTIIYSIQPDTIYTLCIKYDSDLGGYYFYLNDSQIGDLVLGDNLFSGSVLVLGNDRGNSLQFRGSIYLHDCYIKINDVYWWLSYLNNITIDSYSGIASETIPNGSSGKINVIL